MGLKLGDKLAFVFKWTGVKWLVKKNSNRYFRL